MVLITGKQAEQLVEPDASSHEAQSIVGRAWNRLLIAISLVQCTQTDSLRRLVYPLRRAPPGAVALPGFDSRPDRPRWARRFRAWSSRLGWRRLFANIARHADVFQE